MSTEYSCYFVKDNQYRGCYGIQEHLTKSKINDLKQKLPALFIGDFYTTFNEGYDAIEISLYLVYKLDELSYKEELKEFKSILGEIGEIMFIAHENNFKLFLGAD